MVQEQTLSSFNNAQVVEQSPPSKVLLQGWLNKCGRRFKTWKWRYFVLTTDGTLSYYQSEKTKNLKGTFVLRNTDSSVAIQTQTNADVIQFNLYSTTRQLFIRAPTKEIMDRWISALNSVIYNNNNNVDIIPKRMPSSIRLASTNESRYLSWKRTDDVTSYIHMCGYLWKRSGTSNSSNTSAWFRRFFVIDAGKLLYYTEDPRGESTVVPRGSFDLKKAYVTHGSPQFGRENFFMLSSPKKYEAHLSAESNTEMHRWMEALAEAQVACENARRYDRYFQTCPGMARIISIATRRVRLSSVTVEVPPPYVQSSSQKIEFVKRTEGMMLKGPMEICYNNTDDDEIVPSGSQLIAINNDDSVMSLRFAEAKELLVSVAKVTSKLRLTFVKPPAFESSSSEDRMMLVKVCNSRNFKSHHYKRRRLVIHSGSLFVYSVSSSSLSSFWFRKHSHVVEDNSVVSSNHSSTTSSEHGSNSSSELKAEFVLKGCDLKLLEMGEDQRYCILLRQSPVYSVVIQASSEDERTTWASMLYCAIRFATQGVSNQQLSMLNNNSATPSYPEEYIADDDEQLFDEGSGSEAVDSDDDDDASCFTI